MSNSKRKIFIFFYILTLLSGVSFGSQKEVNDPLGLTKIYITKENIIFQDDCLLIFDGQNSLYVKTLHQDSNGIYYYHAALYGKCPNGHPYTLDGGCLGAGCLYN